MPPEIDLRNVGYIDVLKVVTDHIKVVMDQELHQVAEQTTYSSAVYGLASRAYNSARVVAFLALTDSWGEVFSVSRGVYECALTGAYLEENPDELEPTRDELAARFWRYGRAQRYVELSRFVERGIVEATAAAAQLTELRGDFDEFRNRLGHLHHWARSSTHGMAKSLGEWWPAMYEAWFSSASNFVHPSPRSIHVMGDRSHRADVLRGCALLSLEAMAARLFPVVARALALDPGPVVRAVAAVMAAPPVFATKTPAWYDAPRLRDDIGLC